MESIKIREIRLITLNWSQIKLAKEMGVSQAIISAIENGLAEPSAKFVTKLKKVLLDEKSLRKRKRKK